MGETFIFDHPLIQHKLTLIRDKNTGCSKFRELINEMAMLMAYEVTRELPMERVEVETPIKKEKFNMLTGKKPGIVPILRAGLGMMDGILQVIPAAKVGHIGLYRDEETHEPVEYYCKLPSDISERELIIVDPMLATGGTASAGIKFVKEKNPLNIKFMCIIAAPEGIDRVHKEHPDVVIYTAALDEKINDQAFIVPGLGDAGDRLYGTD